MTWKFSLNFEEYLLKSSGRQVYKIKMALAVLHNHFKGNVKPEIEKNWPNINFELIMSDKMAHGAEAHKKSSKKMCDAN